MAAADQIKGLADLLILQQRLRQAPTEPELLALLVNDTRQLFPYRTAVVLSKHKLIAVTGLPEPVRDAPFTQWIENLQVKAQELAGTEVMEFTPENFTGALADDWTNNAPGRILWLPLINNTKVQVGVLALMRDAEWRLEEQRILGHWAGAAAHALDALQMKKLPWWHEFDQARQKRYLQTGVAAVVLLLLCPVRSSVIVSSEVVPRDPVIVRSQLDGVIGEIAVTPNALVKEGDLLLSLDESAFKARLDVAQQDLEVAKAEYLRAEQASILDRSASAQRYLLTSRIEQRSAEVDYIKEVLGRTSIKAQVAGLVMIPDITELNGRPVKVGEKIMTLAQPDKVELEAWLPVDDSLPLAPGGDLKFYLNVAPTQPIEGTVSRIDYQAQVSPDGILAFRIRATLDPKEPPPRIGLRGTARVYGGRVTIFYYLMRKPLAYLRQVTGF